MTTLQTKEQRQSLNPQAFIGLHFPIMSNFFRIPWSCIMEKIKHVSSFQNHTSETNTIYILHSICWADESKREKSGKLWQRSCFSPWLRKEDIITRKIAQILTVQWSHHFQVEEVWIDWPERTVRSRFILFCLSSLSFKRGQDNEPSYMSPEGKPLKLAWTTAFVYKQWLLAPPKVWFSVQLFKSAFTFPIAYIYSKSGFGFFGLLFF